MLQICIVNRKGLTLNTNYLFWITYSVNHSGFRIGMTTKDKKNVKNHNKHLIWLLAGASKGDIHIMYLISHSRFIYSFRLWARYLLRLKYSVFEWFHERVSGKGLTSRFARFEHLWGGPPPAMHEETTIPGSYS